MLSVITTILTATVVTFSLTAIVQAEPALPTLDSIPKTDQSANSLIDIKPQTAATTPVQPVTNSSNLPINIYEQNQLVLKVDERIELIGRPQTVVNSPFGINRVASVPDESGTVQLQLQFQQ
ncbi:hypothetical protein BST81_04885 [Leptolyngbya sp. 'hensonii']|uniref:hypothetical protein n=1 Tax=Leptolyngbya sp. 'hensonii' TaxID=1922337 RepID=UPI0009501AAA|nr:hypothetical protein [Leptolyngbya sp. 'hensonii']OLP19597.1 hypothetical protein BST81_04885 [Leptolyngbya sp. 'hensonii']